MNPAPLNNTRGIVLLCIAMAGYTLNDTFVKLASGYGLPSSQIMAVRGVMALLIFSSVLATGGLARQLRGISHPLVLIRALIDALVAICFIWSVKFLPLADITAIVLASPLFATALSAVILQEKVGWRRWAAVLTGFAGMLLVAHPSTEGFQLPGLLALVSAFGVAVRDMLTRRLPAQIPSTSPAFATTVATAALGFASVPLYGPWVTQGGNATAFLLAAAVFLIVGNLLVAQAFRNVDILTISPFRYTSVLWATLLGYAAFGTVPDKLSIAGIALIVGSGLYTLHREKVRRQAFAA